MRTLTGITLLSLAVVAAACSGKGGSAAADNDLKRDLALAASSATDLASTHHGASFAPTEIAPLSRPQTAPTLKRRSGPKAVRTPKPTVKAAPEPEMTGESEVPETQLAEASADNGSAPNATVDESLPAVPRPTPAAIPASDPNVGVAGSGNTGVGAGEVLGGIIGIMVRGGGMGEDRCEIHDRRGRRPSGGGVYYPPTTGRRPSPSNIPRPTGTAGGEARRPAPFGIYRRNR